MKKASIILLVLICIALICGYAIYDRLFPKAPPICCPDELNSPNKESIVSISVSQNDEAVLWVKNEDIGLVMQHIPLAESTRKKSINDYPTSEVYYSIVIETPTRTYRYFLYAENSQAYIEVPYEGIYKIDQQILDVVVDYFKD